MDKIKIKYIFDDLYNPKYVNGAFGGINGQGEIIVHFFLERGGLPYEQTYEISDGSLGEEIKEQVEPENLRSSHVRVVENGIVLNYRTAKAIHAWLGNKIKDLEERIQSDEL